MIPISPFKRSLIWLHLRTHKFSPSTNDFREEKERVYTILSLKRRGLEERSVMDGGDATIGSRLASSSPPMWIREWMRAPSTTSLLLSLKNYPLFPSKRKLDATHSTMGGEERGLPIYRPILFPFPNSSRGLRWVLPKLQPLEGE